MVHGEQKNSYIPPKTSASTLSDINQAVASKIEQIKAECGEHIFVFGGDLNKRDLTQSFVNHPEIYPVHTAPTRGKATLDLCFTNTNICDSAVVRPLFDNNGVDSDHSMCLFRAEIPRVHYYDKKEFWARSYTEEGEIMFGTLLANFNWDCLDQETSSQAASIMAQKLGEWEDACFPRKLIKVRSCDKPWITNRMKRLIRRKKRAFFKHGKGERYHSKAKFADEEIKKNKIRFFNKVKQHVVENNNVCDYFRAIKLLQTEQPSARWEISSLFPGLNDTQVANRAAEFFNKISSEFDPIPPPNPPRSSPCTH